MPRPALTAERLRELLHYDPETGVFVWLVSRNANRAPEGAEAGWLDDRGARMIEVDQRNYKAHRLAWLYVHGCWPKGVVDHRNTAPGDNRIDNLRDVTQFVNMQNRRAARKGSRSGLIGAHWRERDKNWRSSVYADGKVHRLGSFDTAEEAHAAYVAAKRRLHEGCTI